MVGCGRDARQGAGSARPAVACVRLTDVLIRAATPADVDAIVDSVNAAYQVERFFVEGNRTSVDDVRAEMSRGTFLVATDDGGAVVGSVFVEVHGGRGAFGMLAVAPSAQRAGLGRLLIDAAERHAMSLGASVMHIHVVNLRTDLLPRYARLGYLATGTGPYVHRPVVRPCHFILMSKPLGGSPDE